MLITPQMSAGFTDTRAREKGLLGRWLLWLENRQGSADLLGKRQPLLKRASTSPALEEHLGGVLRQSLQATSASITLNKRD
jgi:hypothetical protein